MSDDQGNGWLEYKLNVMHQLEYLTGEVHGTRMELNTHDKKNIEQFGEIKTEISLLKQKSGMWGAVAGAVAALFLTVVGQLIIHAMTK